MITDINSEDRLVRRTFAEHLEKVLGWESVYAYNNETFGSQGTLGRSSERDVVLVRDLRAALKRLNRDLPVSVLEQAIDNLIRIDFARSLLQGLVSRELVSCQGPTPLTDPIRRSYDGIKYSSLQG